MTAPAVGDVYEDRRKPGRRVIVTVAGDPYVAGGRTEVKPHGATEGRTSRILTNTLTRQWVRVDNDNNTEEDPDAN